MKLEKGIAFENENLIENCYEEIGVACSLLPHTIFFSVRLYIRQMNSVLCLCE